MNKNKYIIRQTKMFFSDGTKSVVKNRKAVYNIQSYREYLMAKYGALRVEFVYDTIPASLQGCTSIKIKSSCN